MSQLNPRQKQFLDEYLVSSNATQAYRAAYPKCKSDEAAKAAASRLLACANVQAELSRRRSSAEARAESEAADILRCLWEEARRKGKGSSHSARVKALHLLGMRHGLFPLKAQHEHSGPEGGAIPVHHEHDVSDDAALAFLDAAVRRQADRGLPPPDGAGGAVHPPPAAP